MRRTNIESIELRNIGFAYDSGDKVFSDVNFSFNSGEVLFLQGPRGSGKNTLIKLLLGLLSPTSGEYLINGLDVSNYSYSEFDTFRLNMGYSYDVGGLINNQTLFENFRLLLDYHNYVEKSARFDYVVSMMERFHLHEQKHLRPAHVSSPTQKAASVLRAFLLNPEIIVLDDPTHGIHVELIPALVELIHEHQRSKNLKHVIISSDDESLISSLGGRVLRVTSNGLVEPKERRKAA